MGGLGDFLLFTLLSFLLRGYKGGSEFSGNWVGEWVGIKVCSECNKKCYLLALLFLYNFVKILKDTKKCYDRITFEFHYFFSSVKEFISDGN